MGASVINLLAKDVEKVDGIELRIARRVLELRKQERLSELSELILKFLQKQPCINASDIKHLQLIEAKMYADKI